MAQLDMNTAHTPFDTPCCPTSDLSNIITCALNSTIKPFTLRIHLPHTLIQSLSLVQLHLSQISQ